jgi:hypothetical protein
VAPLAHVDDLATVFCAWAEMELRHENYKEALDVSQESEQATMKSSLACCPVTEQSGRLSDLSS